eukprot:g5560.t1
MKGSVALLAGALLAIASCSHALPPVGEISSVTHKRPGAAGAVSFGSSSVAGVEGAFEAAAAAGLDRDPISRGVGVDGDVGAPAEASTDSTGDDEALDAFGSVVASCAASAVIDEGELICRRLECVVSRETEVAEQEVLLRVAHLDDYFAIAGEHIRRFHRPLPWSWELICRQLEEVVSQEAEVAEEQILLRMANLDDYFAIAYVRFDVFSPVHSTLKHRFREKSCLLMRERRRRGAFCLVAALGDSARASAAAAAADRGAAIGDGKRDRSDGEGGGDVDFDIDVDVDVVNTVEVSHDHVLGTLECSRHEFDGTPLEVQVEEGGAKVARLYLTEVAVRSDCRRKGVGRVLLGLVDDVAKELKTSEVFLHVNEINEAALRLYESCGYNEAPDCASNRAFTNSLGLSGGFIGQRHRLLHKTFPIADASGNSGTP